MKIFIARLLGKKFILHYPDGYRTYALPYEQARPLQALHGGKLEIVWKTV
jgi:hypothetical protein